MKTLEHQLADYGEHQRELHGPISPEELVTRLGRTEDGAFVGVLSPSRRPAETRPRRPWLVAAATAVAVLVLVGGATWLVQVTGSDTPVAGTVVPTTVTDSTPTTVADSPVATTPEIDSLSSLTWSRVPDGEGVLSGPGGQGMADVIVAGPGFVGVGHDRDDAAVWTSADGTVWSRVPHNQSIFGGEGDESMASVTVGGPGLVAVGSGDEEGDHVAAVWTSVDGITWSRVAHDDGLFGEASMQSVTAGGPGLVAVGSAGAEGDDVLPWGDGDRVAAVWTSVDGIEWSRVAHDESIFGGPDNQTMNGVTVGGPGLVAVGYDGTHGWDNPNGDAAVWTSIDGITWSPVPHDISVFGARTAMVDVTAGGPGLVAVGYSASGCRPVWTSVDGVSWSRVPDDVPGACSRVMRSVMVDGSLLVAVGHGAASWESVDGVTWTQLPDGPASPRNGGRNMVSVTSGDSGLIAVGFDYHIVGHDEDGIVVEDGDAAVWTAATED